MKLFCINRIKGMHVMKNFLFFFFNYCEKCFVTACSDGKDMAHHVCFDRMIQSDIVMSSLTDWDELHPQSTAWEPLLTCFWHEALIRLRLYEGQVIYSPVIRGIQPENVRWTRIFLSLCVGFNFKMSFSSFWRALEEFSKPSGRHGLSNNAIFHLPIASLSQGFQRNPR